MDVTLSGPDWPAIEGGVTSIAIVVGGLWAGWKWGYGEALRRRRELPDLDGTLSATTVSLPGGRTCLALQSVWRNPGPGPIRVCPDHSFVEQYELGTDLPLGGFRITECPGIKKISVVPWRYHAYIMGAQTESVVTEHFIVPVGPVYAFTWRICLGRVPSGDRHPQCSRELIWGSTPVAARRALKLPARRRGYGAPHHAESSLEARKTERDVDQASTARSVQRHPGTDPATPPQPWNMPDRGTVNDATDTPVMGGQPVGDVLN